MTLQQQLNDLEAAIVAKQNETTQAQRELQILKDAHKSVVEGKDVFHSPDIESVVVRVLMQKFKQTCI